MEETTMFGRKREADGPWWVELQEWAEYDLKKPFQAAGLDLAATAAAVDQLESKASGSTGHPWPIELKLQMVRAANGSDTQPEFKKRVGDLQMQYEAALRGERTGDY
jgi:hypothetical protein